MGELFRRNQPDTALEWTGERLVSGVEGPIESEHLHRYFLARDLCRGKKVLDVASGEGYGTALLAQTAAEAIGVELDQRAVDHAAASYRAPNLRYLQGSATRLPAEAGSLDVVVSFETLEHFFEHELFYAEVKRVLTPAGFLIVSTPDTLVYSGPNADPNPYHVHELTSEQFLQELNSEFRHVALYRQRVMSGSAILPDVIAKTNGNIRVYEQRDANTFESHGLLPHSPYLIGLAGNAAIPGVTGSLYVQSAKVADQGQTLRLELERLQAVEAAAREQAGHYAQAAEEIRSLRSIEAVAREQTPLYQQSIAENERRYEEIQRLKCVLAPLQVELERLKNVEAAAREQGTVLTKALADSAAAREETANLTAAMRQAEATAAEEQRRVLEEVAEREQLLSKELENSRTDVEAMRQQLVASAALLRQQKLVVQRLQASRLELAEPAQAVAVEVVAEAEVAVTPEPVPEPPVAQSAPVPAPAKPLIPVWARKMVPEILKPPLRTLKRAIRPPQ